MKIKPVRKIITDTLSERGWEVKVKKKGKNFLVSYNKEGYGGAMDLAGLDKAIKDSGKSEEEALTSLAQNILGSLEKSLTTQMIADEARDIAENRAKEKAKEGAEALGFEPLTEEDKKMIKETATQEKLAEAEEGGAVLDGLEDETVDQTIEKIKDGEDETIEKLKEALDK